MVMKTFKLLLAALLIRSAYAKEYKQEQNEYLINQMTKEEYKQIEKKFQKSWLNEKICDIIKSSKEIRERGSHEKNLLL